MRTTSALEGFNSQLGRRIPKKGNFFKFVNRLSMIEFVECRKMTQMIDSGGSVNPRRENPKDVLICDATVELKQLKISVLDFLKKVTYSGSEISMDMAHFDIPAGYISEEEIDDDVNGAVNDHQTNNEPQTNSSGFSAEDMFCIVCADQRANVLFLPCRHMKCCTDCSSKLAAENVNNFACPYCKQLVLDTIVAYV